MFRPPELYNLTKPAHISIYIYIYIIRGRSPQCLGPPWRGSAALAVAIKSGPRAARGPRAEPASHYTVGPLEIGEIVEIGSWF